MISTIIAAKKQQIKESFLRILRNMGNPPVFPLERNLVCEWLQSLNLYV